MLWACSARDEHGRANTVSAGCDDAHGGRARERSRRKSGNCRFGVPCAGSAFRCSERPEHRRSRALSAAGTEILKLVACRSGGLPNWHYLAFQSRHEQHLAFGPSLQWIDYGVGRLPPAANRPPPLRTLPLEQVWRELASRDGRGVSRASRAGCTFVSGDRLRTGRPTMRRGAAQASPADVPSASAKAAPPRLSPRPVDRRIGFERRWWQTGGFPPEF